MALQHQQLIHKSKIIGFRMLALASNICNIASAQVKKSDTSGLLVNADTRDI